MTRHRSARGLRPPLADWSNDATRRNGAARVPFVANAMASASAPCPRGRAAASSTLII